MEKSITQKVVVMDAGGQYCHLIATRLRRIGVYADVRPCSTPASALGDYKGIVISGGPSSVYGPESPKVDPRIFEIGTPVLGICYGHQLMASMLGGTVKRGAVAEYGLSRLSVITEDSIFRNLPHLDSSSVWMSHRDLVTSAPGGFELLAKTESCSVAAMGNHARKLYGVQFHPEVAHTKYGNEILEAFCFDICGCKPSVWQPAKQVDDLIAQIQSKAAGRKVFFFVSGGVDSTVAFVLCLRALGPERVEGVFVDTGCMRDVDIADIEFIKKSEHATIHIEKAGDEFIKLLESVYAPEEKRKLIGEHFVTVHERILARRFCGHESDWMLGQGTIYPDTIESGGTPNSSTIKTHHNRVGTIVRMLQEGRVLEPLAQFYKDEVREIGGVLKVSRRILKKQPFPGPGLAIRCICSANSIRPQEHALLSSLAKASGYTGGFRVDLKTVGVKGDERSYQSIAVLAGNGKFTELEAVSTKITNEVVDVTRVVYLVSEPVFNPGEWEVVKDYVTASRLDRLRAADSHLRDYMMRHHPDIMGQIWQFPVILLPLVNKKTGYESVVLRPVNSIDGMTASFTKIRKGILLDLAASIRRALNLHVFFDITNKPPATIEWE